MMTDRWSRLLSGLMVDVDKLVSAVDANSDIAGMDLSTAQSIFDSMTDVHIYDLMQRRAVSKQRYDEADEKVGLWFERKMKLAARITVLSTGRPQEPALADQPTESPTDKE